VKTEKDTGTIAFRFRQFLLYYQYYQILPNPSCGDSFSKNTRTFKIGIISTYT